MKKEELEIIKEFIEATPAWLDSIRKQDLMTNRGENFCIYCGANYDKIKEFHEILKRVLKELNK